MTNFEPKYNRLDFVEFAWLWLWLVVTLASLGIAAAIVDGEGRKPWHHYSALPEHVAQVDKRSYIIEDETISPSIICRGTESADSTANIEQTTRIKGFVGLFVVCAHEQTWGDHRAPSVNFAHGAVIVAKSPWWWVSSLVLLALCLVPGLFETAKWNRVRKFNRDGLAADAKIRRSLEDAKLRELTKAYANCAIDAQEYEAGIARAYQAGVEPAE